MYGWSKIKAIKFFVQFSKDNIGVDFMVYIELTMNSKIKIGITKVHFHLFSATLNFSLVQINGLTFFNLPVLRAHKILGLQKELSAGNQFLTLLIVHILFERC